MSFKPLQSTIGIVQLAPVLELTSYWQNFHLYIYEASEVPLGEMNSNRFHFDEAGSNVVERRRDNPVGDFRERRGFERIPTEQHARFQYGVISYKVAIEDFSSGGCRTVLRQGLMPSVGTVAEILFTSGIKHSGIVVWQAGIRFGFQFKTQQDDISELLFPEQRGSQFFRDLMRLQNSSQ